MKMNIKKTAMDSAALIAGAVGAGYVTKFVPIQNEKVKAAAPILVGMFLMNQKGPLANVGMGLVAAGGANLAKSFGIGEIGDDMGDIAGILDEMHLNGPDGVLSGTDSAVNGPSNTELY
jgi:hypothetical protein